MIKLLIRFGKWLESRFPEKVQVTQADYTALLSRIDKLEKSAVHVDAVRDVVRAVKQLKDDHDSFKASMGFTPHKEKVLEALLNGQMIGEVDSNG